LIDASVSGLLPEPLDVDLKDQRGLSPLNCAAIKGDFDIAKLLIINGNANIDQPSPKGCTPLLYAARGGYSEVVRFLVLKNASTSS
jgi:ankyrin repeat protein